MHDGPALIDGPEQQRGEVGHDLRLVLPANAQNVILVRQVVTSMAEALELPADLVGDIRLAVTEACTNVVRHAYAGRHGRLEVRIAREAPGALTIVVADCGCGLRPRPSEGGSGLGLPLMAALAHALEFEQRSGSGSRVCMRFRLADG